MAIIFIASLYVEVERVECEIEFKWVIEFSEICFKLTINTACIIQCKALIRQSKEYHRRHCRVCLALVFSLSFCEDEMRAAVGIVSGFSVSPNAVFEYLFFFAFSSPKLVYMYTMKFEVGTTI